MSNSPVLDLCVNLADRREVISAAAARMRERSNVPAMARVALGAPTAKACPTVPASDPLEMRRARIEAAIRHLKARCILVTPLDREARVRRYRVSGRADSQLAEDVVALAVKLGFEVSHG